MSYYSSISSYSTTEIGIHNILVRNKEHMNCALVIRESHKDYGRLGLFCADHDHYFKWLSEDEIIFLHSNGILTVKYRNINDWYDLGYLKNQKQLVTVINRRSGKKVEIYREYLGESDRDPSLKSYWDNIDCFKKKI